jgi:hypothetical protein
MKGHTKSQLMWLKVSCEVEVEVEKVKVAGNRQVTAVIASHSD